MAIAVERKTKGVNWLTLAVGLFALIFAALVVYFLFLAPVPLIEKIIPEAEIPGTAGLIDVLSDPSIDPSAVVGNVESLFQNPISQPDAGKLGRPNPFQPI
ncbi:MAG: hypothetical protein HYT12_00450 [Candidatus Liptonbacteria bacterium]|nr:hypothetical protein [Candidatus Liptonbacteria bacterium]